MMSPGDFPNNYGGEVVNMYVGVNTAFDLMGRLYRVGAEYGQPLSQDLNGIQLEQQERLELNLSTAF